MRKWVDLLERALLLFVATLICVYCGDYLSVRFQIPKRPQTRDVSIRPIIAVPEKGRKSEYILGDPFIETCSNSLFPQLGNPPCWYTDRHRTPRVDI